MRDRFGWKQAALARNGACRGGWLRCLLALALPSGPRQSREQSSSVWSRGDRTCTHNVTWTARAERTESCFQSLRWLCNDWCYAHIPPIASPSTLVAVQYRTVLTNFSLICGCVSILDLSHSRARALADEWRMFLSSCQQDVVAKRRLCPELNAYPICRTCEAPIVDCSVSSGLP